MPTQGRLALWIADPPLLRLPLHCDLNLGPCELERHSSCISIWRRHRCKPTRVGATLDVRIAEARIGELEPCAPLHGRTWSPLQASRRPTIRFHAGFSFAWLGNAAALGTELAVPMNERLAEGEGFEPSKSLHP